VRFFPIRTKMGMALLGFCLIVAIVLVISFLTGGGAVVAQDGGGLLVGEDEGIPGLWWLAPVGSILALVFAFVFYKGMKRESEGTDEMKSIAQGVREGANAYLKRQFSVVAIVLVVLAILLAVLAFVELLDRLLVELVVPRALVLVERSMIGWTGVHGSSFTP